MICIQVNSVMYAYDMYHITKAFCPGQIIEQSVNADAKHVVEIASDEKSLVIQKNELAEIEDRKLKKRYVNLKVYEWLKEVTGRELSWGIMTGVRPTKPMMNLMEEGLSDEEVVTWMQENYRVTDEKAQLGLKVAKKENLNAVANYMATNGYKHHVCVTFGNLQNVVFEALGKYLGFDVEII